MMIKLLNLLPLLLLFSCTSIKTESLIVACEQKSTRIILLDADKGWPQGHVWSWHPADSPEITPVERKWFGYLTDAKRVMINGEEHFLTCASGGAAALIRVRDKKAVFHAYAGYNAHSVALLPDGNIVAACSTPNHLTLLRRDGAAPVKYPLKSAHGLVWDSSRQCLWALGYRTLKCYTYQNEKLGETAAYELPDDGGHDLSVESASGQLFVTTHHGIWLFDRDSKKFSAFQPMPLIDHVKSISQKAGSSEAIFIKAEEKWWSENVRFLNGQVKKYPGARFYKARWWQ